MLQDNVNTFKNDLKEINNTGWLHRWKPTFLCIYAHCLMNKTTWGRGTQGGGVFSRGIMRGDRRTSDLDQQRTAPHQSRFTPWKQKSFTSQWTGHQSRRSSLSTVQIRMSKVRASRSTVYPFYFHLRNSFWMKFVIKGLHAFKTLLFVEQAYSWLVAVVAIETLT